MKYLQLFEQYISERVIMDYWDANEKVRTNPAFAKKMLKLAIQQYDDEYQESYTVDTGKGEIEFGSTFDTIFGSLGRDVDQAPFDWGVNLMQDKIEWFAGWDDEGQIPFDFDKAKLSEVIKALTMAMKKAESVYNGEDE